MWKQESKEKKSYHEAQKTIATYYTYHGALSKE